MHTQDLKRALRPGVMAEVGRAIALAAAIFALFGAALTAQETGVPYEYDQAAPAGDLQGTYGYVRALDGSATLVQQNGDRIELEVNEPVLVGDRIFVSGDSRVEIVLADRNVLRLGDGADLGFRALAESADATDPSTVLDVRRGTIQLVVAADQLGRELPSIVLPNATVQTRLAGSYLIVVDDEDYAEVVVREGRADVLTASDGAEVRVGEALFVEGGRNARLEFAAAPSLDRLEEWGQGVGRYALGESERYVDSDLHYSAAHLDRHGTWVSVGASRAWRPYVSVGWAPYRHGRWRYTPSGLFWVSYEPWGWVPYHYGYWDHDPGWGWVWFPGRRFATAHVYWYWGSGYAGWVPAGYYWRHYGRHYGSGFGFHFGIYGWVNGSGWYDRNRYWTFLPTGRLGHVRQQAYLRTGYDLGRSGVRLGRGILTNDTRELRPDVWRRPGDGITRLTRAGERGGGRLADATPFASRVDRLPGDVERVAIRGRADAGGTPGARSTGGALRSGAEAARRPSVEVSPGTRASGLRTREGASTGSEASRPVPRVTGRDAGSLRRPDAGTPGSLRRPAASGDGSRARAAPTRRADPETRANPTRRPALDRRSAASSERPSRPDVRTTTESRPTLRRPGTGRVPRTTDGRELRRPSQPVTRRPDVGIGASRPTVRSGATARPTVRSGGSARPTAGSSRPTVRSSGSARPTVRSSRPAARSSTPTVRSSRPTVRSSRSSRPTAGSSRPTVRSSGSARPTVRSSRPTVRSGGGARPAVRSGSSGVRRSSGATRSRRAGGG